MIACPQEEILSAKEWNWIPESPFEMDTLRTVHICFYIVKVWCAIPPQHMRVKLLECNSSMELLHENFLLKYQEMMTMVALLWCWWT
jgi:hypothetical protein